MLSLQKLKDEEQREFLKELETKSALWWCWYIQILCDDQTSDGNQLSLFEQPIMVGHLSQPSQTTTTPTQYPLLWLLTTKQIQSSNSHEPPQRIGHILFHYQPDYLIPESLRCYGALVITALSLVSLEKVNITVVCQSRGSKPDFHAVLQRYASLDKSPTSRAMKLHLLPKYCPSVKMICTSSKRLCL